jgi:hypothetical protein
MRCQPEGAVEPLGEHAFALLPKRKILESKIFFPNGKKKIQTKKPPCN